MTLTRVQRTWAGVTALAIVVIVVVFSFSSRRSNENFFDTSALEKCVKRVEEQTRVNVVDPSNYIAIWNICNLEVYYTLSNEDFAIRREKFRRQELDERVNLWLVVVITLSGVALSAIQLTMSYKLATLGRENWEGDTTIALEQGKLSLKSSIMGLAILALSLAFFVVYVKWIYATKEEKAGDPTTPAPISITINASSDNGLGPAPQGYDNGSPSTNPPQPVQKSDAPAKPDR